MDTTFKGEVDGAGAASMVIRFAFRGVQVEATIPAGIEIQPCEADAIREALCDQQACNETCEFHGG